MGLKVLAERTRRLAARAEAVAPVAPSETMVICEIAGGLYSLPIAEVARIQPYRRAGAAAAASAGVIGLAVENGRIRPVADLALRLGLPRPAGDGGYLLTLTGRDLALRAEALPETAQVEPMDAADGARGRVLDGVHASRIIVRIAADDLVGQTRA